MRFSTLFLAIICVGCGTVDPFEEYGRYKDKRDKNTKEMNQTIDEQLDLLREYLVDGTYVVQMAEQALKDAILALPEAEDGKFEGYPSVEYIIAYMKALDPNTPYKVYSSSGALVYSFTTK